MIEEDVRRQAFAMPLTNPAYPPRPYRFIDREYLVITYRTDPAALARILPAPLVATEPLVKYEFINMPDSTGFGHYCESGQVIPVRMGDELGSYLHSMYLNDHPPIAAGRELWGFPKKLGDPELRVHKDTLVGTLDYSDFRVATGTMGFKHKRLDSRARQLGRAQLPAEDHPACGRHAANLRVGALLLDRHYCQGRLERTGCAGHACPCACTGGRIAGTRSSFRRPHHRRSDVTAGCGRARLSCLRANHRPLEKHRVTQRQGRADHRRSTRHRAGSRHRIRARRREGRHRRFVARRRTSHR
jgi:hypothetical protein